MKTGYSHNRLDIEMKRVYIYLKYFEAQDFIGDVQIRNNRSTTLSKLGYILKSER